MEQIRKSYKDTFKLKEKFVCTIGVFDGCHKGHLEVLNKTIALAKENNLKSVVFTFDNHPDYFVNKSNVKYIEDFNKRLTMFERLGFDICVILNADENLFNMEYEVFNNNYLSDCLYIVEGSNFRYGKDRLGNIDTLKKRFNCISIDLLKEEDNNISSSFIRDLLKDGNIEKANSLLNYNFYIEGVVIEGNKIGRTIGFNTANIVYPSSFAQLRFGVYKTYTYVDNEKYLSISNVGIKPTIGSNDVLIETHLIDFNKDIYGKIIKVEFIKFVRDEQKFKNLDELVKQINIDLEEIKK